MKVGEETAGVERSSAWILQVGWFDCRYLMSAMPIWPQPPVIRIEVSSSAIMLLIVVVRGLR